MMMMMMNELITMMIFNATYFVGEHVLLLLDGEGAFKTVVHVGHHFMKLLHILFDSI